MAPEEVPPCEELLLPEEAVPDEAAAAWLEGAVEDDATEADEAAEAGDDVEFGVAQRGAHAPDAHT